MRIGRVVLTVHDLERVSGFYQQTVGLTALEQHRDVALLGAGETVLLELRLDRAARRRSPNEAGLFHTAFLLPTRGDLGRWTRRAMADRTPITGSADHLVSEAIYLDDPEANGVEIYADRPAAGLVWQDGLVLMRNTALDVAGLVAEGGATEWRGAPPGTTVGHVHLQVGALAAAEEFYAETLGFAVTRRAPGATFFASGRYHHHLATNVWNSAGAAVRADPSTGLTDIEILGAPSRKSLRDPWGTSISLVASPAEPG